MSTTPARPARRRAPEPASAPLGPRSLTWELLGDSRHLLLIGRTGVLQTMHPAISQGLIDHSDYFDDPIGRFTRSAGPILGVVYDEDAGATAGWVRDRHRTIRSAPHSGSHGYRALDPEVYYWAHATFVESLMTGARLFGRPLSEPQLHQLYAESVSWYRRYGMTMAPVPRDLDAFRTYWDETVTHVLEATPVASDAVHHPHLPVAPGGFPDAAWRFAEPFVSRGSTWLTRGTLPAGARTHLDLTWSAVDETALRALRLSVKRSWMLAPRRAKYLPRARVAMDRAGYPPSRRDPVTPPSEASAAAPARATAG